MYKCKTESLKHFFRRYCTVGPPLTVQTLWLALVPSPSSSVSRYRRTSEVAEEEMAAIRAARRMEAWTQK